MAQTVIQHVLSRLHDLGVKDVFGVPGDYAFPVNDAVCSDPRLRWVGCCNELNAAYAADGYARIRGLAALSTTYGVGEAQRDQRHRRRLCRAPNDISFGRHAGQQSAGGAWPRSPHTGQRRVRSVPQDDRAGGLCTSDHDPGQLRR